MSDSEHDDEFEAYLKRRRPGKGQRGMGQSGMGQPGMGQSIDKGLTPPDPLEPPPELDRIIIGKARNAIHGAPPMRHYRAPKWALPVGLAATIVISFVVVLDLSLRAKRQSETAEVAQEPMSTEPISTDVLTERAPGVAVPAPAAGKSTSARKRHAAVSPAPLKVTQRIKLPPIPTVPWPPAAAPSNTAPAGAGASETPDGKARTRLARAEVAASRSRIDTGAAADVPAELYGPAEKGAAEPSGTSLDEAVVTRQSSAPPAAVRRSSERGDHVDPAAWLSQIEKLRSEGHTAEAEQEIKHFREVYPAYPAPVDAPSADGRGQ